DEATAGPIASVGDWEGLDISAMAGPFELKRLWGKYREYRAAKKQRCQASSESSNPSSKGSMVLEEATGMIIGYGLDTKQEQQCIEYALDVDPRFIDNPDGIGCSRTYEDPYVPYEFDEQFSFPKLAAWRTDSIDRVKGKRKGRMPGDSADDRYKSLLDILASRPKSSTKKFSLLKGVRELAWTR
ncbi:MAG: hypothetical protein ALECFALPRED_011014, partial [Alectoria fallacina]